MSANSVAICREADAGPLMEVAGHGREAWRAAKVSRGCCERCFFSPHAVRGRYHCVKNR